MELVQQINTATLPQHLAIIMDGNGRWAKQKGLIRALGHESGTKSVKSTVETCAKLGIKNLTLYAFSTENWNRPKEEVDGLMKLLVQSISNEVNELNESEVIELNELIENGDLNETVNLFFKERNQNITSEQYQIKCYRKFNKFTHKRSKRITRSNRQNF